MITFGHLYSPQASIGPNQARSVSSSSTTCQAKPEWILARLSLGMNDRLCSPLFSTRRMLNCVVTFPCHDEFILLRPY